MNNKTRSGWGQWHSVITAGCILALLAYAIFRAARIGDHAMPRDFADKSNDVVVARVDGIPIYRSELNAGLPMDWFGASNSDLKTAKFERLIEETIVAQFLAKAGVRVERHEIDGEVEIMRKDPPPAGCMCCRYASLEQFMGSNGYDMAELRREIANDIGMNHILSAEWDKNSKGVDKASDQVKARARNEYMKASHIFFNTFQKPDFKENPDRVHNLALHGANEALQRMCRGEQFETVAAAMSEDAVSNAKGGMLGCIPRDALGQTFASAVDKLKPGEYSKPVETEWGIHIIRREAMTDTDILTIVRNKYVDDKMETTLRNLINAAKIERLWKPK